MVPVTTPIAITGGAMAIIQRTINGLLSIRFTAFHQSGALERSITPITSDPTAENHDILNPRIHIDTLHSKKLSTCHFFIGALERNIIVQFFGVQFYTLRGLFF